MFSALTMLVVGRKRSSELRGERTTVSIEVNDVQQVNASSAVKQKALILRESQLQSMA
jgi:hypothetical protein